MFEVCRCRPWKCFLMICCCGFFLPRMQHFPPLSVQTSEAWSITLNLGKMTGDQYLCCLDWTGIITFTAARRNRDGDCDTTACVPNNGDRWYPLFHWVSIKVKFPIVILKQTLTFQQCFQKRACAFAFKVALGRVENDNPNRYWWSAAKIYRFNLLCQEKRQKTTWPPFRGSGVIKGCLDGMCVFFPHKIRR